MGGRTKIGRLTLPRRRVPSPQHQPPPMTLETFDDELRKLVEEARALLLRARGN